MKRGSSGMNLLLGIDKPAGMSSHDVVNHVRRALGEKRVGHAGTLDPAATGVLVVGVGQGTRLMGMLTADRKSYLASIRFGFETTTDDAEGEPTVTAPVPPELYDEDFARRTLAATVGSHLQVPPAYSAISVGGKRSYARARAGEQVELDPRPVEVYDATLVAVVPSDDHVSWHCAFSVSKGTYVRALARDLGRQTHSAAHLEQLCRTTSGHVTLAQCVSLESVASLGAKGIRDVCMDPVSLLACPVRRVAGREVNMVANGRPIEAGSLELAKEERVAIVSDDLLLGVWSFDGARLKPVANFPQGIEGVRS